MQNFMLISSSELFYQLFGVSSPTTMKCNNCLKSCQEYYMVQCKLNTRHHRHFHRTYIRDVHSIKKMAAINTIQYKSFIVNHDAQYIEKNN